MSKVITGAEPFFYSGSDVGCLLVHGFTATAQEMHGLGRFLAGKGLTVRGVLLAGHGTTADELAQTTWREWFTSVNIGYQDLMSRCHHVFALGLSLGGSLCLHLAAHRPLAGVVSMAGSLYLSHPLLPLMPVMRHFMRHLGKGEVNDSDWNNKEAVARRIAYGRYPLAAVDQFMRLQRHLRDDLPEVGVPALLMHSREDKTIDPANMPLIFDLLGSQDKQMVWIEHSNHVITEDCAYEQVWQLCHDFVAQRMDESR